MTRPVAFLLALLFAGSTAGAEWLLCAGSPGSRAASHACCSDMQMAVSAEQAMSCCILSEQTRERAPIEPGPAIDGRDVAAASVVPATGLPPLPVAPTHWSLVRPPSTPLYLQQRSLLI